MATDILFLLEATQGASCCGNRDVLAEVRRLRSCARGSAGRLRATSLYPITQVRRGTGNHDAGDGNPPRTRWRDRRHRRQEASLLRGGREGLVPAPCQEHADEHAGCPRAHGRGSRCGRHRAAPTRSGFQPHCHSSIGVGYSGANQKTEREGMFCGKRVKYFSGIPHPGPHHDGRGHGTERRGSAAGDAVLGGLRRILLSPRRAVGGRPGDSRAVLPRRALCEGFRDRRAVLPGQHRRAGRRRRKAHGARRLRRSRRRGSRGRGCDRPADEPGRLLPHRRATSAMCRFYNTGVESDEAKSAAALIHHRMFQTFAEVAQKEIPPGIPLYISGGCGLNCDWNEMFRELGHFSSVFVPPCANDSGSAVGPPSTRCTRSRGIPVSIGMSTAVSSSSGIRSPIRPSGRDGHEGGRGRGCDRGGVCRGLGSRAIRAGPKSTRQPIPAGRALPREHEGPSQRHQAPRGIPPHRPVLPARGRSQGLRP